MPDRRIAIPPFAMPLGRRAFLRGAAATAASGAALYAVGCGGGDDTNDGATATPATIESPTAGASSGIKPVLITSEFVANAENRFVVGLLEDGKLVKDADVHVRFFQIGADGATGTLRGEGDLEYVELNVEGAHAHDSSGAEVAGDDSVSFYVAGAPFDTAGKWGAEIAVKPHSGAEAKVQVPFDVLATSGTPAVGAQAPRSRNDTAATNTVPGSICSRDPVCPLHDKVIADTIGKGRPAVVMFSTPAFCASRFCGPVLEVLLAQVSGYEDRVDFIHIEVWQDFQLQKQRETVGEWNLPTEPYTFFIDGAGAVAGKLEAVFSEEELKSALDQLVAL